MNEENKAIELELYDSYTSDIGITQKTYEKLNALLNLVEKQQKEIKSLTDENNFLKEMYKGTTEYKAIESFID